MMRTGDFEEQEKLVARAIDQRTVELPDGTRLRTTPAGQKTVELLVDEGDIIKTTYETGGKVISVYKYTVYGLPVYSITYVDVDATPFLDGHYRENDHRWINECVAQDDRILQLFEANKDEILIVQKKEKFLLLKTILAEHQRKQQG